ncbi:hypothetical protein Tco_1433393, partial [Tanacetum coccineum]
MENLYPKLGLVSRTYSKNSLIMASILGFKSNFFMIMSPFILSARLTALPVVNSAIKRPTNHGKSLRTSPSTTMKDEMKQKEFVKPVKDISTSQGISKTPDRRLLELEDHINFLLKGSRPTPTSSSAHTPQAYVNAVHPNSRPQNQNEPAKLNTFAFHERTGPSPQPQTLGTTFEARVRDYMVAHTKRMERFENAIFKQREEINGRMTEMFGLLKELKTSRTPEKVLIREEAKFPVTKNVNSISLTKREEERSNKTEVTPDNTEKPSETKTEMSVREVKAMNGAKNGAENESIKT